MNMELLDSKAIIKKVYETKSMVRPCLNLIIFFIFILRIDFVIVIY